MTPLHPAVQAVARTELRRHWRGLLLLAVAVGLVVGAVAGTAAVARRTGTALDRLRGAGGAEDVRVQVFSADPGAVDALRALPGVGDVWDAGIAVGRLPGAVTYVAVMAGPPPPPGLFHPVVVDGRAADPERADEVVVSEAFAEMAGVRPGDTLPLDLLTAEEVTQFDVGFGEPDGPHVDLQVTGVVRLPPGSGEQTPVIAGAGFVDDAGPSIAGRGVLVRLDGGRDAVPAFAAEVDALAARFGVAGGAEEFSPFQVSDPAEGEETVSGATRVLVTGLGLLALVGALAGALALGQATARSQARTAPAQRVEAALGMTASERTWGRVLPAVLAAGPAAAIAAAVVLLAGRLEPLGPLRALEPHPGWRPDGPATLVAAVAAAVLVVGLTALAARRAGRPITATPPAARSSLATAVAAAPARPSLVAGFWLALAHGRGSRSVPMRSALATAVVGVAGLVAAATFTVSLDRLEAAPPRWGWAGDVVVVDASPPIVEALVGDARTEAVGVIESASAVVDGRTVNAWALRPAEGEMAWSMVEGREPSGLDEVALGPKLADRLGVGLGDTVTAAAPDGSPRPLRVVGAAVVPTLSGNRLGSDVVVSPELLADLSTTTSFTEAMVRLAPGIDVPTYVEESAASYELVRREPPAEVANLADLGALPAVLGGFLALVGALALLHALVLTVRRRAGDLAVLRAIGFTPGQTSSAVVGASLATAAGAVVLGLPLGLAVGRLTWWVAATDAGVAPDASIPWWLVAAVVPVVLAGAALLAAGPAWAGSRRRPGPLLRAE